MRTETRLDPQEHRVQSWRIGEIAHDFELIDVWRLPAQGRREEFGDLPALLLSEPTAKSATAKLTGFLFAVRLQAGQLLGWDDQALPIPGCTEMSLRERLPTDLPAPPIDPSDKHLDFQVVFQTDVEYAAELSNKTVHAVLHLGWVEDSPDQYHGQLGVYVKNRGRLGRLYMAAIAPFRHYVVYPALLRHVDQGWRRR